MVPRRQVSKSSRKRSLKRRVHDFLRKMTKRLLMRCVRLTCATVGWCPSWHSRQPRIDIVNDIKTSLTSLTNLVSENVLDAVEPLIGLLDTVIDTLTGLPDLITDLPDALLDLPNQIIGGIDITGEIAALPCTILCVICQGDLNPIPCGDCCD